LLAVLLLLLLLLHLNQKKQPMRFAYQLIN
jgi:hypothetical protein